MTISHDFMFGSSQSDYPVNIAGEKTLSSSSESLMIRLQRKLWFAFRFNQISMHHLYKLPNDTLRYDYVYCKSDLGPYGGRTHDIRVISTTL